MSQKRGEAGIALLTVMIVLVLMLSMGLSLIAIVDTQTGASAAQRERDSTFNLAESVLTAQIFTLGRDWPGVGQVATPYPSCTQATVSGRCPESATLLAGASPDLQPGAAWSTSVHDNDAAGTATFYAETLTGTRPGYDANGDGRLWVRASASARGRTRTLVALVGVERKEEPMPQAAIIAGKLELSNNGNKTLVQADGGLVAVRCVPGPLDVTPCLGHTFGSGKYGTLTGLLGFLATQISGATPVTGYQTAPTLPPDSLARLRATAVADGTAYAGCPSAAQLTGRVVYVESGTCSYTSNTVINSAAAPGLLILANGSVSFGGTLEYHGVVYAANLAGVGGTAVSTEGNAAISGGVIIDGMAGMVAGSSSVNVRFDPNAYRAVASYGATGIVQNTWRELTGG